MIIFREPHYIIRKYFTFEEMLDFISATYEDKDYWDDFKGWCSGTSKDYKIYGYEGYDDNFEIIFNDLINSFFRDYVFYIDYFFNEDEPTISSEVAQKHITSWVRKFYSIYNDTKDRYLTLINIYEEQKDNLLNKVGELQKIKFNDTPQNNGNFDDDEHLSAITTTEREIDFEPLINRIDGIYTRLKNLYKEWSDEFKNLFIFSKGE